MKDFRCSSVKRYFKGLFKLLLVNEVLMMNYIVSTVKSGYINEQDAMMADKTLQS